MEMHPDGDIVIRRNVMVPMRDGVRLNTEIWRPSAAGRFPVLLFRLPYGDDVLANFFPPHEMVRHGYVVIAQQCRGCSGSEGEFWPYPHHEAEDGYDAVEWAASEPWSDGRVGMYGASYGAITQIAAAGARPPHLVALCPVTTAGTTTHGFPCLAPGVVAHDFVIGWGTIMAGLFVRWRGEEHPVLNRWPTTAEIARARRGEATAEETMDVGMRMFGIQNSQMERPPDALFPEVIPWFAEWIGGAKDSLHDWRDLDRVEVPALHITGWYDATLRGTLDNFVELSKRAATEAARAGQRLLVGPWEHWSAERASDGLFMGQAGELRFFDDEKLDVAKNPTIRFFDHWLKGTDNGLAGEPRIRLFVMGDDLWRDEHEWPLARTRWTPYFLASGGNANGADGDGSLVLDAPASEGCDRFVHDPRNPVPTCGGPRGFVPGGPVDQRSVEARSDVLVYTSTPLASDLEVTGPVSLELWVGADAPDAVFTAKLVDVHADGRAINLCEGVARSGDGNGAGGAHRLTMDLWATSNVFKAGHRVRLEVAGSSFPRIFPDPASATISQTVHHGPDRASRLVLPVIPR